MLKHKKILSLLLLLPVFSVFSCSKAKEEYNVHTYSQEEEKVKEHLLVSGDPKREYDSNKGETLDLTGLTIVVDGQTKDLGSDRINKKDEIKEGIFFVCSREDLPTNTIIGSDYKATTNVESADFTFYIAAAIKVNDSYEIYVSQGFKVTIKNSNAIKPWVWYVVTGVVIFGVIGMVMLTRHYKNKKQGNI